MVQGVMCCGTFVTRKALIIAGVFSGITLLAGLITLGVGLGYDCYYYYNDYYNYCYPTRDSLIINGGIVTGLGVVFVIVTCVLACKIKDPSPPTMVSQQFHATYGIQNMSPGQVVTHPLPSGPGFQVNMSYPQQYQAAALPHMAMSPGQLTTQPPTPVPGNPQQYQAAAMPHMAMSPGQQTTQPPTAVPGYPQQNTLAAEPQGPASPP